MDNAFTISERTGKLLAIYRDFNRVANELWKYFKPEDREGHLRETPDDIAERRYRPFTKSVNDINERLLAEISTNIENAIVFGDDNTQI